MESAIFGLVGVVIGGLLTVAKEWWFQNRKIRKDAEYLSIQVSCELERYVVRCAEVVADDGLCEGRPDENGYCTPQVLDPEFDPKSFSVEWKSLPANLMYEVLDFPYKAELASRSVASAFEYAATPPDFCEGFEERQFQFATLGIAASKLATKLRNHAGLPARSVGDWNPVHYMEEKNPLLSLKERRELGPTHHSSGTGQKRPAPQFNVMSHINKRRFSQ